MTTIAVGDIGGTHSRLILIEVSNDSFIEKKSESLSSKSFPSFRSILHQFLDGETLPKFGIFAIAGVCRGHSAKFVNMGWTPDEDYSNEIEKEFGIGKVIFLNDFEAAGLGCLELKSSDYYQINSEIEPIARERIVVMGPGTGLGEALLVWNGQHYTAWPGEGGHSDFAPHDEEQWRFAKFMMNLVQTSDDYAHFRPCEGVSQEVCMAGVGAFHIYEFYRQEFPELIDSTFEELWQSHPEDRLKHMMLHGFKKTNELAEKSVNLWLKILAYECGNLISKNLPYGGIYLIGGLVTRNYNEIIENINSFTSALLTKPKHICDVIHKVPLYIVSYSDTGMKGTIRYAKNLLNIN
jgi:glucokinase